MGLQNFKDKPEAINSYKVFEHERKYDKKKIGRDSMYVFIFLGSDFNDLFSVL